MTVGILAGWHGWKGSCEQNDTPHAKEVADDEDKVYIDPANPM